MPEEPKQEVIDDLVGCALSYSAFNIVKDLNTKLSLLQQVNKKYGAISNKLRSGNISDADLDAAVPAAKEKLSSEIERKDDLDLDSDESKKLALISSSKVDQLVNFLKQKRNVQIDMSIVFKEPET
ncbi:MAG: hypothetical protein NWF08_06945 [Candidatus Bathyarchaeota archaeon]|nr:hypothetical protein [Candidatus Bathyarchaeota archaeon]